MNSMQNCIFEWHDFFCLLTYVFLASFGRVSTRSEIPACSATFFLVFLYGAFVTTVRIPAYQQDHRRSTCFHLFLFSTGICQALHCKHNWIFLELDPGATIWNGKDGLAEPKWYNGLAVPSKNLARVNVINRSENCALAC